MHSLLDSLEGQLKQAKDLEYISHIEFYTNRVVVYFSPHVLYKTIHELVTHINLQYKDVAWIPRSMYLSNPRKQITIHYKRDHA